MATTYTEAYERFNGNGVATEFSFAFPYKRREDVKVYIKRSGQIQTPVLDTDFEFITDQSIRFPASSSTLPVLQTGDVLAIQRESLFESDFVFENQRRLEPADVMDADDNMMRLIQENKRDLEKAIKIQPTSGIDSDTFFNEVDRIYESIDSVDIVAGVANEVTITANNIDAVLDAPNQAQSASESARVSRVWATGSDPEVQELEEHEHSSRTYSNMAKASAASAEESASLAEQYATQATSFSGRIIQLGFDGTLEDDTLVFKHAPSGVDIPYDLLDDYEYELDLAYFSTENLPSSTKIVIRNGADTINFVSALHRDSTTPVTVSEMNQVMRFNDATGYRWLFKAAFKITPAGHKVFLLYPVISLASSGLEIGDIGIASFGIDESLNLRRYLNGQVISQSQFQSFTTKIKKAIELYPNLSATEENWQAEVMASVLGQCGKFVIDDTSGTIRLPKVVNINSLQDLALIGGIMSESLPNITSGNAPVQQEAIQYPYFIQVATGVEETLPAISEYKLNNPNFFGQSIWSEVSPNNASWLLSNGAFHSGYTDYYNWLLKIHNGTETVDGVSVKGVNDEYTDYDFVINTADSTFRLPLLNGEEDLPSDTYEDLTLQTSGSTYTAPANGWVFVDKNGDSNQFFNLINVTKNYAVNGITSAYPLGLLIMLPVGKGDMFRTDYNLNGTTNYFRFIYATGNGTLYYYVGDTLQDPALINAGRALNDIAELKGYAIVETYHNGAEWYRIWSDGWCEQGGIIIPAAVSTIYTANFIMPFKDGASVKSMNIQSRLYSTATQANDVINQISGSQFNYITGNPAMVNNPMYWSACGIIE